jgi:predicted kinase
VSPLIIAFAGLPGVGKSTLARETALRKEAVWLRVDTIEAAIVTSGLPLSFETGLAAYIAVQNVAADQLRLGRNVVIDAVNGVEPAREMWRDLARDHRAKLFFIEVVCSDKAEHRRRVESRGAHAHPLPLPTWSEVVEREYAPWSEPILTVDSLSPIDKSIAQILGHVSA